MISDAIDPDGPEMTLKRGDHLHGRTIIGSAHRNAVAVSRQSLLQPADIVAYSAELERLATHDRRRLHPVTDAGIGQRMPREFLAGILLARGRHVGVAEHAMRRHLP